MPASGPSWRSTHRLRSLAVTPGGSAPIRSMRIVSGTRNHSSPVAQIAAISLRPTPAPYAPSQPKCVVWLSEPRISCPGQTSASSLITWWQMPRPASKKCAIPWSATKRRISA